MAKEKRIYRHPPRMTKADGDLRKVGFELEFSGLSLDGTLDALGRALGGSATKASVAEGTVDAPSLGSFQVELDWSYLKKRAAEEKEAPEPWLESLSEAAALLVPMEVVCPPLSIEDLPRLDEAVEALRRAGAVGTEESLIAAYGVHINAEIPSLDAATLHAYLKAFCLLQWWLVEAHDVDGTRRLSPYVDLYDEKYVKAVLSPGAMTMEVLFETYLEHNASRNRALDLLPLLAEVDEGRLLQAVKDEKVNRRPTFHYRLPNCQIDHPGWSLARSWNIWCLVEELADRDEDLTELAKDYLDRDRPILGVNRKDWVASIDRWLVDRALL